MNSDMLVRLSPWLLLDGLDQSSGPCATMAALPTGALLAAPSTAATHWLPHDLNHSGGLPAPRCIVHHSDPPAAHVASTTILVPWPPFSAASTTAAARWRPAALSTAAVPPALPQPQPHQRTPPAPRRFVLPDNQQGWPPSALEKPADTQQSGPAPQSWPVSRPLLQQSRSAIVPAKSPGNAPAKTDSRHPEKIGSGPASAPAAARRPRLVGQLASLRPRKFGQPPCRQSRPVNAPVETADQYPSKFSCHHSKDGGISHGSGPASAGGMAVTRTTHAMAGSAEPLSLNIRSNHCLILVWVHLLAELKTTITKFAA